MGKGAEFVKMLKGAVAVGQGKFGKGLFATRHVRAGECLSVEKPIAVGFYTSEVSSYCESCCTNKVIDAVKATENKSSRCPVCKSVCYCSKECQKSDWGRGHKSLCKIYTGISSLSNPKLDEDMRIIFKVVASGQLPKLEKFFQTQRPSISQDYKNKSKFCLEMLKRHAPELLGRDLDDSYFLEQFNKTFRLCFAANAIDRHAHVGLALWDLHSFLNHSCEPNAETFVNNITEGKLFATKDIEAGSEILISYGFMLRRRSIRQKELLGGFGISCTCARCSSPENEAVERYFTAVADFYERKEITMECVKSILPEWPFSFEFRMQERIPPIIILSIYVKIFLFCSDNALPVPVAFLKTTYDLHRRYAGDENGMTKFLLRNIEYAETLRR